jgi:hypothetical protein
MIPFGSDYEKFHRRGAWSFHWRGNNRVAALVSPWAALLAVVANGCM